MVRAAEQPSADRSGGTHRISHAPAAMTFASCTDQSHWTPPYVRATAPSTAGSTKSSCVSKPRAESTVRAHTSGSPEVGGGRAWRDSLWTIFWPICTIAVCWAAETGRAHVAGVIVVYTVAQEDGAGVAGLERHEAAGLQGGSARLVVVDLRVRARINIRISSEDWGRARVRMRNKSRVVPDPDP